LQEITINVKSHYIEMPFRFCLVNGKQALEIRRTIFFCEKNKDFFIKLAELISRNDQAKIIVQGRLDVDCLKARLQLKKIGFNVDPLEVKITNSKKKNKEFL